MLALHTGFEPARLLHPTVFKTAPSPPGHAAFFIVKDIIANALVTFYVSRMVEHTKPRV